MDHMLYVCEKDMSSVIIWILNVHEINILNAWTLCFNVEEVRD